MIIDVSTQIWSDPTEIGITRSSVPSQWKDHWQDLDPSASAHDEATSCVDLAFVLGFRSEFLNAHLSAESVASFVAKAKNRRIGFAGIDPMHRDAMLEIDRAMSLGLSGISIAPAAQNYHPAHSRAMRVYEHCERLGLPIIVLHGLHLSSPKITLDYARPTALDEVARNFPDLKMVISHFGCPWIDEAILMVGKHSNLYLDTAGLIARPWTLFNSLMRAYESCVLDKVLFASGFPFASPEQAIKQIYSINGYSQGTELPSIPRAMLNSIVERDSLDCLGLQRPEGASIGRGIGRVIETPGNSSHRDAIEDHAALAEEALRHDDSDSI